jgi:hypothetical protein
LSATSAERALTDALDSLFKEPLSRRKIRNVWIITIPALRAQPAYELCVQISPDGGTTKVMYWQNRPRLGWVGWILWSTLGACAAYGWKVGLMKSEEIFVAVVIVLLYILLPFLQQDRTRQILAYAFGSSRDSAG